MLRRALAIACATSFIVVAVPATAFGGGCHSAGPASSARGGDSTTIHLTRCSFSPTVLFVDEGAEVTWVNDDPLPHSVTGAAMGLWGDKMLEQGDSFSAFRFDRAGVFPYACILHPGMVGAVVVGDAAALGTAAEPAQAEPVAAPGIDEAPPADGNGGPSAILVLGASLAAIGAAIGALFVWRRARVTVTTEDPPAVGI
jgi:plastocyanin